MFGREHVSKAQIVGKGQPEYKAQGGQDPNAEVDWPCGKIDH